jgi:DNA-3-methyladenine glycosylase
MNRSKTPEPMPRCFYDREPIAVARDLLGKLLIRETAAGMLAGRIVETEAYLATDDPACHAAMGPRRKNAAMFGPPGHAYVYPIHARYCFNVVTEPPAVGSAVLIRALQPLWKIETTYHLRPVARMRDIANGPAKLCAALDIARDFDGWDLIGGQRLWISEDELSGEPAVTSSLIGRSVRIGVTSAADLELRFFVRNCEFVSGPKRLRV